MRPVTPVSPRLTRAAPDPGALAPLSAISNHPDPFPLREGLPFLGPALVPRSMNFDVRVARGNRSDVIEYEISTKIVII